MKKIFTILLIFNIIILSACFNDDEQVDKINNEKKENLDIHFKSIDALSIHYKGKMNEYPAFVSLYIAEKGNKIRADYKSLNGKDTLIISYLKIGNDYYYIDHKNNVITKRPAIMDDFMSFLYVPVNKLVKIKSDKFHLERYEDMNVIEKKCTHLKLKTDSSQADFYVWNNILLKVNTKIEQGETITKLDLSATTIEPSKKLADSLFKIGIN